MRRSDWEVTDINVIIDIVDRCDVCRIAMIDRDRPYIVPMNYGYRFSDGSLTFYFHSAKEGRKIELLKANPNVCVEMDCGHELIVGDTDCSCTMVYESVIGNGTVLFIEDKDEKIFALSQIMRKYTTKNSFEFDEKMVDRVAVFKIVVRDFIGKRHKK